MPYANDLGIYSTGNKPCRNIDARDLLERLGRRKIARQMCYSFSVSLKELHRFILVYLKRDNVIRMEFPCESSGDECRRTAECADGG